MRFGLLLITATLCLSSACGGVDTDDVPRPAHVVIVVEENKNFQDIAGSGKAPYIEELVSRGALMEESHAVTHPSFPNYLALFSGSTHGIADDKCHHELKGPNLAQALEEAGLSFAIFSEDLPHTGSRNCGNHGYTSSHNPVAHFPSLPGEINRPLSDFPSDFSTLPTVAFVIPNVHNDMHDGDIRRGDVWLREHLDPYVRWSRNHESLFILTFDEDDFHHDNRILTLFSGAHVQAGRYSQRIDHYDVLSTLAAFYKIPAPGEAAKRKPISGIWKP